MKICVYGASSSAIDKVYLEAGEKLGRILADRGHSLVFGGGATGMMGAVAQGVADRGGEITGVAPRFFDRDGILRKDGVTMVYTETMRERKDYMEQNSDAFIVTPGGIGTFEEFFETFTLKQLRKLYKPIVLLNTDGYYDSMMDLLKMTVRKGFLDKKYIEEIKMADGPEEVIQIVEKEKRKHLCPVCNETVFSKRGSYEICDICGWEDDAIQEEDPDFAGGANKMSLSEAREAYWKKQQ